MKFKVTLFIPILYQLFPKHLVTPATSSQKSNKVNKPLSSYFSSTYEQTENLSTELPDPQYLSEALLRTKCKKCLLKKNDILILNSICSFMTRLNVEESRAHQSQAYEDAWAQR